MQFPARTVATASRHTHYALRPSPHLNATLKCQLTKPLAAGDDIDRGGVEETSTAATVHTL
jgi:hypothetical protein